MSGNWLYLYTLYLEVIVHRDRFAVTSTLVAQSGVDYYQLSDWYCNQGLVLQKMNSSEQALCLEKQSSSDAPPDVATEVVRFTAMQKDDVTQSAGCSLLRHAAAAGEDALSEIRQSWVESPESSEFLNHRCLIRFSRDVKLMRMVLHEHLEGSDSSDEYVASAMYSYIMKACTQFKSALIIWMEKAEVQLSQKRSVHALPRVQKLLSNHEEMMVLLTKERFAMQREKQYEEVESNKKSVMFKNDDESSDDEDESEPKAFEVAALRNSERNTHETQSNKKATVDEYFGRKNPK